MCVVINVIANGSWSVSEHHHAEWKSRISFIGDDQKRGLPKGKVLELSQLKVWAIKNTWNGNNH